MKRNKNTKKTFSARSSVSRRDKRQMMKRELIRLAESVGVGTSGAKIRIGSQYDSRDGNNTAVGVFFESQSGYGFVRTEDYSGGDIFIPQGKKQDAIGGDTVEVSFFEYKDSYGRTRTEGRVNDIIKEREGRIVGTVSEDIRYLHRRRVRTLTLIPDDAHIRREIILLGEAESGDKVLAALRRPKSHGAVLVGEVIDIFGKAGEPEASYGAILAECGIETEFTSDELDAAERAASEVISDAGRTRYDGVIFTIDSEWAKDLDDAIAIRREPDGYTLFVHIADVSHYVKEKTALDRLAMARGTSVYFTDKVVPMLPPALSENACSLHPGADKYTLSCEISLDTDANIRGCTIRKGIIRSKKKGVYSKINKIFDGTADGDILDEYRELIPSLRIMHELYLKLKRKSVERGALELDSAEVYIPLDESGQPTDILRYDRGDAEMLIEQFMLAANEAVATYLTERGLPVVYRVHDVPKPEKLTALADYLRGVGIDSSALRAQTVEPSVMAGVLDAAKEAGISDAVSYVMLRSMSKAKYSDIKSRHFGLNISTYCHFTSPIRRLSDLATHRIIHKTLFEDVAGGRLRSYARRAAAAATEGELRAQSAERKIEALYKVMYMTRHIGEEFDARVTGVSEHGIFVTPENTCEGLVPMSELGVGFVYNESTMSVSHGELCYTIGTSVRVRLEEASIAQVRLRYSVVNA